MTGAGPQAPGRADEAPGRAREIDVEPALAQGRAAGRQASRSQASQASTNASDARRRRKSPWLGSLPNSPTSTVRPPKMIRRCRRRSGDHGSQLNCRQSRARERIAGGVRRFDRDLRLVDIASETGARRRDRSACPGADGSFASSISLKPRPRPASNPLACSGAAIAILERRDGDACACPDRATPRESWLSAPGLTSKPADRRC